MSGTNVEVQTEGTGETAPVVETVAAVTEVAAGAADEARADERRWGDHNVEHERLNQRLNDIESRPMVSREEFDALQGRVNELGAGVALAAEAAATAVEVAVEAAEDTEADTADEAETPPAQEPPQRKRGYA